MKRPQLSIFSITLPTTSLVFYFSIASSIIFLSFVLIWVNISSPSNIPLPAQQTTNCLEYFNTSPIVFGFTPSPLAATVPPLPAADHPTNLTTRDDFIDKNNVSVTENSPSKDLSVLKLTDTPSSTPENASSSYFENEAQAVEVLQHELHDDEEEEEEEEEEEDSGSRELDIIFDSNFTAVPAQQIPPAAILIDKIETNTHEDQNVPSVNTTVEQNAPLNRTHEEQTAPLANTTEEQNAPLMNKTEEQNAPILMNKTEEQNAAPLSEKTVQAKSRKKKARATSFDQMTQISSSRPLLVEEDKKIAKLGGCDFSTRGRWVEDESYPLYTSRSCPFIEEGFSCNGRLDKNFTMWRWQPQDCDIPRFDARKMLEFIRGKRLVFVGDSINKNQWQSMVCMLVGDKRNPNKPRFIRKRGGYSVVFVDYQCKVEFYPSVFLVEKVMTRVDQKQEQTSLRIDSIDHGSHRWREADILVFNTEHWWVEFKTNAGVNFFQEGEKIHPYLDVLTALRKGLMTWASWVDNYINPRKTRVFFRTSSPTHFSGGKWNLRQSCVGVSEPLLQPSGIVNEKDVIVEEVLKQMKTRVTLLNTTSLSEYRMDAHPSDIRDCSHWCLPGIPDVWNELLYLHLKVSQAVGAQNDLHVKNEDGGASESDIIIDSNFTAVPAQQIPSAAILIDKIETNTHEDQNVPSVNTTVEQNAPLNRTHEEQTAPLANTTEEQNAPLMNKTEEQNAPILMNKTEEQNAAALSEKTVQAKSRKKKKARATSFDQMTQISSSGPLLVEEDKKIAKLGGCDFSTRGRWVEDESYPLYTSRSCPFIEEGFSCNGRLDKNFTKWRWQPQDCDIPRFDARKMLEFIKGKRLVFVGDSINKNQWQSMVCMLVGDKRNPNKPRFIRKRGGYSVVFVDYQCKVEFYPSVFLVEKVMTRVDQKQEQTSLRIDSIDHGSHRWREADILVFNTEHWWVEFKTNAGVNFFQEGDKIHPYLDVLTALRKGLMTWASWVDNYINPSKTQVFFRTSSPTHFSGGKWNLRQSCVGVSEPLLQPSGIVNEKDVIVEEVLKQMKTRVTLLNTTSLSEYRMDAHPSDIRDCSHWCLPGIPDVWNELLYLHLRVSQAVGAQNDLHVKNEDGGASESDIIIDSNFTAVPAQQIPPAAILIDKIETNTHEDQNFPSVNTTVEQNAPLNRTHEEQTVPLANTTVEQNAPLMNKTEGQNAPILMNKPEVQNAAALSEKTVQAKSRKKKKARATSFDQMTQISSSGPLLVEEDKKIAKLGGCDFSTRGRWVEDESYPLYTSRSCPFIEEGFSCNGRLDKNFTKWRWQPQDCDIPRFDARKMLEFIRGKRLVFVGDSINKNQWQSMVCMLVGDKRNPNKPRFIRDRRGYSVVFVDYQCKVEFYPSVFLVEQVMTRVDQKQEQTSLRIDSIDHGSHRWREADILVFNTEHWWVEFKTNAGVNFFQEGDKIHPYLDVLTALRKGLMTWASWVDNYINPRKTQVFFRTSSPTHFSGGKWNLRQSCVGVSEPLLQPSGIVNEKDVIVEEVLKQMKTRVTLLNTTSLSDYRMDAHPSDIRDCSHWCLPGIPDVWNELLYLHLRVSQAVGAQNYLHVKNEDGGASESDIFTNVTVVPAQSAPAATLFDKIENQNAPLVNTTKEQNEPTSLMNKTDQEQSAPISVNRTDQEQTAALMNKIERESEVQNAPILMNKADQEQNPPTLMNKTTDEKNAALVEKPIKKRMAGKRKKKKSIATSFDQKSSTTQISSSGGMQDIEENKKRTTKLGGCDFSTRGRWVYDESYPLYTRRSCPFIYEGFDCQGSGRLDKNFTKWRWQPQDCEIPRFDATKMLELMRGKRLLYVGDSINRNQFESMVCMLMGDIRDPNRPRISHAKGTYSFYFVDYKFTVEFSPSVFLVEKGTKRVGQKQVQTSLRIDAIDQGSSRWRGADILVFDTEHWWANSKTNSGKNFYQEGGKIHPYLDVYTALRKGLMTWAAWVDKSINPHKTQVFFRTSSPTHFSGGEWKSGRSCIGATEPLPKPSGMANKKDVVLEEVVKQMKTHVTLLNITSLSEYRIDAHPTAIRDCSHWCLPGLPDAWNELLFLHLLSDS